MVNQRVKPVYFGIALLPVCIFGIHELIHQNLIEAQLDVPLDILHGERPWLEAVGRYRFLAASWFFASISLLAVAVLVRNLMRPMTRGTRIAATLTTLVVLTLAVTPTIQQYASSESPGIYHQVGKAVFETALSKGALPGCLTPDNRWLLGRCGDIPVFSMFRHVLDIINALAGLAVGALIAGMILCLASSESRDIEERAAELAKSLRQMRQQLYLSSLILTFGLFFATSWMYWPMPLILDSEKAAYSSLVTASALFTGTYFCLLMLSFYLPVALVLDGRVRTLADTAKQISASEQALDVDDWRATHGLTEGVSDMLRAGFALAAPILAAFAGGISPLAV